MARHVDFRHDGDEAIGGVANDLAHFVLRVVAAVEARLAGGSIYVSRGTGAGRDAPRADFGETRVLLYFDTPALVVREMPLEGVQLVKRHPVEHLLDERGRLVVAGAVEQEAAPREAGRVGNAHGCEYCLARLGAGGHERPEGYAAVEEAARLASSYENAERRDVERVGLGGVRGHFRVELQLD